ncbi:hypothetical protein [Duganella sp. HH101]|uniref:hypothetical protein n=1 Tax=Duganella sp. HH101 TaxID=1781066 RepID=UPI00114D3ABB|nr:hypothetical protein [Duganella sp. HH101]
MEPISTMILWAASLVAVPATVSPKWTQDKEIRIPSDIGTVVRDYSRMTPAPTKEMRPLTEGSSLSDPVFAELLSYKSFRDGWDGEDSVAPASSDVDCAIEFVRMLRSLLPLPGAMLDPKGDVGLYWNTDQAYADINFDRDGTMSFYLRNRSTGAESFHEGLDPKNPSALLYLMELLTPMPLAA